MATEQLKSVTLKSLVQSGMVTGISKLRKNQTGYHYVTLLQGNKPNNVYFGKKTSTLIEGTFSEGDDIIQFLKNAEIVQTSNEAGEIRFKLSNSGTSNYSSKAELMDVFGSKEEVTDFDMELFKSEFAVQEVTKVS
jgi:hypothetical protein